MQRRWSGFCLWLLYFLLCSLTLRGPVFASAFETMPELTLTEEEERELERLLGDWEPELETEVPGEDGSTGVDPRDWIVTEEDWMDLEGDVMDVKPELSFDRQTGLWQYQFPNGSSFQSSVPNGMVTERPVLLKVMDNAYSRLLLDGNTAAVLEDGYLTEPGAYHLELHVYSDEEYLSDYNVYSMDYYFRIIPQRYAGLSVVTPPEGFELEEIRRNGKELKPGSGEWSFLDQDGSYQIRFRQKDGDTACSLNFIRDTTAPFLEFTPESVSARSEELVFYESGERDARIQVFRDGIKLDEETGVLDGAGNYQLLVTDEAGNSRYYQYTVREKLLNPGGKEIVCFIVILAGMVVFLIRKRNEIMV